MKRAGLVVLIVLSGCAANFQIGSPKSATREEITAAFAERDAVIEKIIQKLNSFDSKAGK